MEQIEDVLHWMCPTTVKLHAIDYFLNSYNVRVMRIPYFSFEWDLDLPDCFFGTRHYHLQNKHLVGVLILAIAPCTKNRSGHARLFLLHACIINFLQQLDYPRQNFICGSHKSSIQLKESRYHRYGSMWQLTQHACTNKNDLLSSSAKVFKCKSFCAIQYVVPHCDIIRGYATNNCSCLQLCGTWEIIHTYVHTRLHIHVWQLIGTQLKMDTIMIILR